MPPNPTLDSLIGQIIGMAEGLAMAHAPEKLSMIREVAERIEAITQEPADHFCPECGTRKTDPHDPYVDGQMAGPCKACGRFFWWVTPAEWNGDAP